MTRHRNDHRTSVHGLATTMRVGSRLACVAFGPHDMDAPEFEKFGPWVVRPHKSARKMRHRTLYGARMALRGRMRSR